MEYTGRLFWAERELRELGLDLDLQRFSFEINQRIYRPRVKQDFMSGVRSGVNGTPTFYINGIRFDQPMDEDTLTVALTLAAQMGDARAL